MTKRRKRKTRQKTGRSVPFAQITEEQRTLTRTIATIGFFLTITPVLFVGRFPARSELSSFGRELENWCGGMFFLSIFAKIFINKEVRQLSGVYDNEQVHKKFRRYLIFHLASSFFSNLAILIPLLYFKGYITRWAAFLPGTKVIEDKTAIIISFCVAAIVSSVAGNSAYDLVKHFVLKSLREKETKTKA